MRGTPHNNGKEGPEDQAGLEDVALHAMTSLSVYLHVIKEKHKLKEFCTHTHTYTHTRNVKNERPMYEKIKLLARKSASSKNMRMRTLLSSDRLCVV